MPINQQILLDNRPQGEAVASNFKLVSAETPALADGQVEFKARNLAEAERVAATAEAVRARIAAG